MYLKIYFNAVSRYPVNTYLVIIANIKPDAQYCTIHLYTTRSLMLFFKENDDENDI